MIESAEEFVRLCESERPEDRRRVSDDDAPEHVWESVLNFHPEYEQSVALNKQLPIPVLVRLAHSPDVTVRLSVAMKRRLPEDAVRALAGDSDEGVRAAIARNPIASEELVERLAADASPTVRAAVEARVE
jgi:hypothetical protein